MSQTATNRDAFEQFERRPHDDVSLDEPGELVAKFSDLPRVSGSGDEVGVVRTQRTREQNTVGEFGGARAIVADATGGGA